MLRGFKARDHIKQEGKLIIMSMGYFIKIHGSPFWQARFPDKSGVEVQRSTKARDKKQAEAILAGWALQAHLERQPGLCQARVRRVSAEMSRLVGGDTSPVATYRAARDAALARSKAMGHETYLNRRSALKSFDSCLDQLGPVGGVDIPLEDVTRPIVAGYRDDYLAKGQAPGTVRQRLEVLHLLWEETIRDGLVRQNPVTGVSRTSGTRFTCFRPRFNSSASSWPPPSPPASKYPGVPIAP